jgi:hypothetical protein
VIARLWTFPVALTLAALVASGALAQEVSEVTTDTTASTTIEAGAAIELTGEIIFEDILSSPQFPTGGILASTEGGGANVTLTGSNAISMLMPESFDLTREGGTETLTVFTTSTGAYTTLEQLRGLLTTDSAISVDIGGAIRVSAGQLTPGEYRGLLVFIGQYN